MKLIFIALWFSLVAIASQAGVLTAESRTVNLLGSAQFLEDATGARTLEEVRAMDRLFAPWAGARSDVNFGFTASAYWVRVPLQRTANAPKDWLMVVDYAKLHTLDFYPPTGAPVHTGSSRAFGSRPYFDRAFVFPVEPTPQAEYAYLRVTSRYALTVPLTVWQADAYRQDQQRFQLLQFMYYGGLVVLAMYGLVIFLALRDSRFLIYCAYISTAGMGMFASNGYGRQMLWPDAAAFDEVSQNALLSLAAFLMVLFARRLLFAGTERHWLNRSMQLCQWMLFLTSGLSLLEIVFPNAPRPATQLLLINAMVMGLLVSIAGVRGYVQGRQGIRFFLAGWLVLWLGVTVATLRAYGWIASNAFTSYAMQLSTVVEMALMALALADLLRIEHQSHGKAQAQALAANRALLEITQLSEDKLKVAVQERTEQLEASLQLEKNLREQYVRFGSIISHEFRTPLSVIQSQASLMRKEHERGIDHVSKRLGAIGSATQRLVVMFDKWLHSDAITQTLDVLELKPLDLQPWLQTVIKTSSHLVLNHTVDLQLHPDVNTVMADEYHLGVALTNLIDNAAKYSPASSQITIATQVKDGHVGIAVTDCGPGIPQEAQDKVFAEFFRLSPENSVRGVGLGLSIVQRIARAHDGEVTLSSTPGHGSTFCIWLPTF